MKTNLFGKIITLAVFGFAIGHCFSQGFFNLNFEQANFSGYPPGSINVPITNALPNWNGYFGSPTSGTQQISQVVYDTIDLGGGAIVVLDTNVFGLSPIQGKYSVLLHGSTTPGSYIFAIGQTGQIPITTQSLIFWGGADSISFNGHPLSIVLLDIGANPTYNIYGADISSFAGQTGELLFTALSFRGAFLDNIQLSNQPIPEPSSLALGVVGALLFSLRRWRSSNPVG